MDQCRSLPIVLALACLWAGDSAARAEESARDLEQRLEFFEKKIRPILVNNCYNCHSADTNSHGGLRVDDRNGLLTGGGRGAAVVPGNPDKSLLLQAVRHTHATLKMPPKKQLEPQQIADLTQWIQNGAVWPSPRIPFSFGKEPSRYPRLRSEHWAWQPLRTAAPPAVRQSDWPRSDIDRFVLAGLEARSLQPTVDAGFLELMRRLAFDLTGLPPTSAELADFEARLAATHGDEHRQRLAVEKWVDQLLASPAFGEHWGRHWLDVARYGESTGSARNLPYPHAWRYRDYVIDAFNRDKPYDQFVREQIAGDLLPASSQEQRDKQRIATGFLAMGVRDVNQRFKVRFVMDNIDEQIDALGRAFLGLTLGCARCHDHKFDPIPMTDYYALAGIFHSTDVCAALRNKMGGGGLDYYDTDLLVRLGPDRGDDPARREKIEQTRQALATARAEQKALQENVEKNSAGPEREKKLAEGRQRINKIQRELVDLNDPALQGPVAMGVRDARKIGDTEIRIRGEAEQLGPVQPRGFLSLLSVADVPKIHPQQSGRLELAQWLTSPHNPMTPRVAVNRVWHHLFGRGIVPSVDNFGATGELPSHPELLDHLAQRFVRDGWSIKRLIRAIVLSRTYQLASMAQPTATTEQSVAFAEAEAKDPDNRLLWRHTPRRLTAEEIRDTMLAAAGTLDRQRVQGSPTMDWKVIELSDVSPQAKKLLETAAVNRLRSVYLPLVRGLTPRSLEVFDFAEQGMVTGSRDATTVAPQALYLLNDPFVREQAKAMAERLAGDAALNESGRIGQAYRLCLGRPATEFEIARVSRYLREFSVADTPSVGWVSFCQALFASAEFRYLR